MSEDMGGAAPAMFQNRKPEPAGRPVVPIAIAGAVVLALVLALLLGTRHKAPSAAHAVLPPDAYAASVPIPASGIVMSESTSLSGGKSTFIDGRIQNTGSRTVTAIEVQVQFANDEGLPAQTETLPLMLIRTHEPYVDTEAVDADPIKPGETREFRLIFENIGSNWNQSLPMIRVVKVK